MQTCIRNTWWCLGAIIVAVVVNLIPSFAFATSAFDTSSSTAIFTIAPYDQSVLYLSELFGNVPPFLNGTGSQLMGHLFKVFNTALLTLGVIFTGYTTFVGILNTAGEGEMLGKGWHSIWVPIRTVAGIALLIPTASGYCVCQLFMMWLLMQGIGAADTLTGTIVNYMETDMPVFAPAPGVITSPDTDTTSSSASTFYDNTITVAFQALSCMQATYKGYPDFVGTQTPQITTDSNYNTTYNFQPILTQSSTTGGTGSPKSPPTFATCGKITIHSSSDATSKQAILATAIMQGLNAIIPSLNATAYYMVNQANSTDPMQDTFNFVGGSGFLTELERVYSSFISQAYYTMNTQTSTQNDFYEDIRNLGWVTLGTLYWDMAKSKGSATNTTEENAIIMWSTSNDSVTANTKPNIGDASENPNSNTNSDYSSTVWQYGNVWANQFIQDLDASRKANNGGSYQSAGANDPAKIGTNAMAAITMDTLSSMQEKLSGSNNPMVAAQELGHEIALTVEITSMALTLLAVGMVALEAPMSSVSPGFAIAQAVLAFVLPGLMLFMGIILTLAGTLSVVIPMIPALAYFLAVIAWLIGTLETIVAAPIVAIGVLHPDGQHQVWGKAEPAIMLIINMFLRPSLIVIGMAAGVILSFITMQFVNFGFNQAILKLMGDKAPTSVEALLFLTTYVGIVLACVNKSFSTIDALPEQVMRWIQGGEGTKFGGGQEAMQKVQSGQEGHAQKGGEDTGQRAGSDPGKAGEANKERKQMGDKADDERNDKFDRDNKSKERTDFGQGLGGGKEGPQIPPGMK